VDIDSPFEHINTGSTRVNIITDKYPTETTSKVNKDTEADMRFTVPNARPTLTSLGHRLLHLSESKLANLESPLATRDEGSALWKGVVVREAMRTAWKSVEEGYEGELTDWRSKGAMGLDVIGEDDEEEYEQEGEVSTGSGEEKWFEDILESLGDDEYGPAAFDGADHEWVESSVSMADFDDVEYNVDRMEAFTLPPVPTLPPAAPNNSPIQSTSFITEGMAELEVAETQTHVEVEAVDDISDGDSTSSVDDEPRQVVPHVESQLNRNSLDWPTTPLLAGYRSSGAPLPSPANSTLSSPEEQDHDDLDYSADDFLLPPPLHRSMSSVSNWSDDDCVTPPVGSCEDLEEDMQAGRVQLPAGGDKVNALGLSVDEVVGFY